MKKMAFGKKYLLSGQHGFFSSFFIKIVTLILVLAMVFFGAFFFQKYQSFLPSVSSLYKEWKNGNYQAVYDNSGLILKKRPLDGSVLALHGFASYYLYAEQTDPAAAQVLLATSIINLRNAWYRVSENEKPQIAYILGKAYYQRGYYYTDLSMKYLDFAYNAGLRFDDLAEFRGLASSMLGDFTTSISAFTEALSQKPSDLLLFTLAQTYLQVKDMDKAKQYLYETIRTSGDELLQIKCHYVLGTIFLEEQKVGEAQGEFNTILEKDPNSADAYYGLGVIYETQGDLIQARAAWRRAIRINPVHPGARTKLNL